MTTLNEQFQIALTTLGPFDGGSRTVTADDGPLHLACELARLESVGCELVRLVVDSRSLVDATADKLRSVSQQLAGRISYLLEPVSPIETDPEGCVVQMRSNPPRQQDDGTTYFELLVRRGGSLSLCRYQKTPGGEREPIGAADARSSVAPGRRLRRGAFGIRTCDRAGKVTSGLSRTHAPGVIQCRARLRTADSARNPRTPMASSHAPSPEAQDVSLRPAQGWHCSHLYYRFDRAALAAMSPERVAEGRREIVAALDPSREGAPARLQTSIVSGHKADFGLMLLDADPLVIDGAAQQLAAGPLGVALVPTYSFVSMTEVSEYVPTPEQYGKRLVEEGEEEESPTWRAKVKAYEQREAMMHRQRLTPDFPPWPSTCFYPMNKKREVGENWFLLDFDRRNRLMAEHGRTGMTFGGKVTQLITVGLGFDDWEWGVTLWARNPEFLRDIVYRMRFDEASARYAQFGPFYTSYVTTAAEMLDHCQIGAPGKNT
jgi:chlorite dismutase